MAALALQASGCDDRSAGAGRAAATRTQAATRSADSRLLDPAVVGPRLVREAFGAELTFWMRTYRDGGRVMVRPVWTTAARGRHVSLRLTRTRGADALTPVRARWRIAVRLDGLLTQGELRTLSGPRGLVPADAMGRRLSSFPRLDPRRGSRARAVAIVAVLVAFEPARARIHMAVVPAASVLSSLIVRRGGRDLALLAGMTLQGDRARSTPLSAALSARARIRTGTSPLSRAQLAALLAGRGRLLAVARWKHAGRLALSRILARPVDALELLADG